MATEQPSFEQARDELDSVVRSLEAGGLSLEESLALWERGEALAATCQEWLDRARSRIAPSTESTARSDAGEPADV